MGLFIPAGYGSAAFIHAELNVSEFGTEPYVWTIGVDTSATTSPQDLANNLHEMWSDIWAPVTSTEIQLLEVQLTVPAVGGGYGSVSSTLPPVSGTLNIDETYFAFAPKVRKQTAQVGRRYKGVFHPVGALAIADVNANGAITSSARERINEASLDMLASIAILTEESPVLLHSGEIAPTPITGLLCQPKVGILRDRML